jgi:hypothetical protein
MSRVAALCGVMAVLTLVVSWEIMAPDNGASYPRPLDAGSPGASLQAAAPGPRKPPPPAFDIDALAEVTASITERPLFNPSRRPPSAPAVAAVAGAESDRLPRLTGVIIGPAGGRAIFAGADGKSHSAAEGDAIGAFQVRTIDPGAVTLSGSGGDRVLHPTYVTGPDSNVVSHADITSEGANITPSGVSGRVRNREGSR